MGLNLGVVGIKPTFGSGFAFPPPRNMTKKQKVIEKARNSLSVSQTRGIATGMVRGGKVLGSTFPGEKLHGAHRQFILPYPT
jgi:hypothetical protein